jgi:CBS domain-containing protein
MKAADVMVRDVITVRPEASVRDAALLMLQHGISGLPVVDENQGLVGVISEGDLIRRAETGTERRRSWWLEILTPQERLADEFSRAHAVRVSDLMTRPVVSADENASLADIATLMERHGIKRVPILRDGRLVGIVSRANLVKALVSAPPRAAGSTDDTRLREQVIEHIRTVPGGVPWLLSVEVVDGVAQLQGPIQSEEQRRAIRIAAEATPGIKQVEDKLYKMPMTGV